MKLVSLIEDPKKFNRQFRAQAKYKMVKETYFDVMHKRKIEQVPGEDARTGTQGLIVKIEKNTHKAKVFLQQLVAHFVNDEKTDLLKMDFEKQAEDDKAEYQNKLLASVKKLHHSGIMAEAAAPMGLGVLALLPFFAGGLIDKVYDFFRDDVGGPIDDVIKSIENMKDWGKNFLGRAAGNIEQLGANTLHKLRIAADALNPIEPAAAATEEHKPKTKPSKAAKPPKTPPQVKEKATAALVENKASKTAQTPPQVKEKATAALVENKASKTAQTIASTAAPIKKLTGTGRQKAFELIAAEEGDSNPLLTPKANTIGYGGDIMGRNTITKEEADSDLYKKIDKITNISITKLGKDNWYKLNDDQKAAIISQAYNARGIHWSGIKKALDHNNFAEAAREIGAGPAGEHGPLNIKNKDLANRRATEQELFAKGDLQTTHIVKPAPDIKPVPKIPEMPTPTQRDTGNQLMARKPPSKKNGSPPVIVVNNITTVQTAENDTTSVVFAPQNIDSPYHMAQFASTD